MIFRDTSIAGAFVVDPERIADERGFFARTWSEAEFAAHGLETRLAQCSVSFNPRTHTLRGMHYQTAPHEEVKLVRCTRGAIFDVIVDLRPDAPTYRRWFGLELDAENALGLYIPVGCAHGFLTLAPDTEVLYQISVPYHADSARGVRWNDPAFGIEWPAEPRVLSSRDAGYADLG